MSIFKNRTVIGVICILLALVICFGITPLFNQSISQKAEIVRVTKDIHAGELITKDMVTTAEVGSYNLPSGLMTAKDNVVGKYAKADLAVGDYILAAKLSDAPAAENAYLYNLDGTKQAISVTIKSFATGLSGKLQSGDIVSVIVADYPEDGETTIPAELQYVEIISVTASTGYDANTGEAKGDEKELPSTVTFLVLPEQAKVLAELEQVAKLHLALVYRGTADGAKQFIEAQDALIQELTETPDLIVVARVPAFSDPNFVAKHYSSALTTTSGDLWMDERRCYWLRPDSIDAQSYLAAIALELDSLGFDEVLFDNFYVPSDSSIVWDTEAITPVAALEDCAENLTANLTGSSIRLALGTSVPSVAQYASRVFVTTERANDVLSVTDAMTEVLPDPATQLVFVTTSHDTRFDASGVIRPLLGDSSGE